MSTSPTITSGVRQWKRYPAYKDSGLSTGVQIPSHWSMMRLKHIAAVRPSNVDKKTVEGQVAVRLCNYVDVYKNESITAEFDFMQASATPAQVVAYTLQSGDVIVTKDSETWMDIAVPAHVEVDLPGVLCGYHLALVRPRKERVVGAFLFRCFAADGILDQFRVAANGITRFGLGTGAIADAEFPLPPLDEQRCIVAFLDRETTKIDALIGKKVRLIELLQEKRTALISHAVTKGLDPTVPMKDSGVAWFGKIPAHWLVKPLGRTVEIYGGSTPSKENKNFWHGDVPWVSPKDMKRLVIHDSEDHITKEALSETTIPLLSPMAVLIVVRGMILARDFPVAVNFVPVTINQDMKALRPHTILSSMYLAHQLKVIQEAFFAIREESGHGTKCLRTELWKTIAVVVPPILEQERISTHIGTHTAKIDSMIAKVQDAIDKLREYRTALISAAVTGKIDVRGEALV